MERKEKRKEKEREGEEGVKTQRMRDAVLSKEKPLRETAWPSLKAAPHILI